MTLQNSMYLASIITIKNYIEIEYTFWLYGSVYVIFSQFKLFFVLADKYHRDVPMNESINHIGNNANSSSYKPPTSMPAERSGFDDRKVMFQTSSKYILDDNKIVFERYDRNGELISRVP